MYGGMSVKEATEFKRAFGFPPDIDDVEVLPDVWDSFQVFSAMGTQWRVGMNGATGLDYQSLNEVMKLLNIEDKATVFSDIRVMELKALELMNSK
ncbi:hypothetical protein CO695_12995 [Providencia alcalifaciens]|uniref:DUF1799 domain-containing protein n=1 Tax=Providencia alcalifaciens DSM 30120 TaxID=520999 RepID=B6XKS6_9GAMM|nr:hypothetical protein CO695_12995 [Providencia alcalifaciens]EEB44109.1 phage related hypothetical protein (DUF1799) [Providencia alcalifaciens DSM 30120]